MFQNLKVDIIYYKTNTDFEMEFNLCGCCRMRLLTDKSADRKVALHSLARAVSRSRIIIVTGSLFGDDGVINLVSSAIGAKLETVDNKAYGISAEGSIEILKGATPLVTADGYFGGCIIESGPQTMILLTENKTVRKNIMLSLIHPYIEELCAMELKEKASSTTASALDTPEVEIIEAAPTDLLPEPQVEEASPEETEEAKEAETTETEETELIIESETDITEASPTDEDIILSEGMIFESDEAEAISYIGHETDDSLYIEAGLFDTDSVPRIPPNEEEINELLTDDDDLYTPPPHRTLSLNFFILIITVFLLIALAILCYCIFYVPTLNGMGATDNIKEIFNTLFGKA